MIELNAILTIAYRDFMKLLRDRARLVGTFVFPLVFIGIMGGSLQSNLGGVAGYDFQAFVFTGVLAQTIFASTAQGLISLVEDRENDFSQEMFITPISRYSIIIGKILGESLVAFPQGLGIILFGLLVGVPMSLSRIIALAPIGILIGMMGGAFGLLVLSNLSSRRAVEQIFPFIMLPQYFLAGVFTPMKVLPWYLDGLSRIAPMRYAVDLLRNGFYAGTPDYSKVVLTGLPVNLAAVAVMFSLFLVVGTFLFVRREHNR